MIVQDTVIELLMDQELGGTAGSPAATVYFGASSTEPDADGTGDTEPTGVGAYARVAKTNNTTTWPACTPGTRTKENGVVITFPTASAPWGAAITHILVYYASSGSVARWAAALPSPETINTGNTLSLAVGELQFVCLP